MRKIDAKLLLKDLIKEYNEQDNRSTAFPWYYVIADYRYIISEHGDDAYGIFHHDYCESLQADSIEKLIITALESNFIERDNLVEHFCGYYDDPELQEAYDGNNDFLEDIGFSELQDYLKLHDMHSYGLVAQEVYSNFFLFEKEAEEHLKANKHRYSEEARTYGMHIWRAPKTQAFLETVGELVSEKFERK